MKRIWVLGLLHSGTTVFWRAWRQDERFLCFDEPLANLSGLPLDSSKRTNSEFIQLFNQDPQAFWDRYAPMHPADEVGPALSSRQASYLRYLVEQATRIVIDETHLHLHLPSIAELTPHGYVIHLYRRASGFVTSHLRPSWSQNTTFHRWLIRRARHEYNKRVFWTRQDYLPGMRREAVIGSHPKSRFGLLLERAGYDSERIMISPTVVRLLAYWHFSYHRMMREGPTLFGDRFCAVRYEDFANNPASTMEQLYSWVGMKPPGRLIFPEVHPPKHPFQEHNPRWQEAALLAGFDEQELNTLL